MKRVTVTIDDCLKKAGKTRYWLAKTIGSTYLTIQLICNNKTRMMGFPVMERICDALNCDISDILCLTECDPETENPNSNNLTNNNLDSTSQF